MSELEKARLEIDSIDDKLVALFEKRMELVSGVADYKRLNNLPVLNPAREREIITRLTKDKSDEMAGYTKVMFTTLFDISRSYQSRNLYLNTQVARDIQAALETTPKLFPKSAVVACQGTDGSNSQLACEKLFSRPDIMYFNSFDAVFSAVDNGMCRYGILPIENSLQGTVTEVYDLMKKYKFHIARGLKMKIDHRLLAKPGAELGDIREIYSHEQALGQCGEFLKELDVKITACENTAIAAIKVSQSERSDIAAISTEDCAGLYGLNILSKKVQNSDNNYTHFICISKALEIYPGGDKMSLMFTVSHRPGSLYGVIAKLAALGINISKLESRPIPERDFEFMFYIDFEGGAYSDEIVNLICRLESELQFFSFLGSYSVL